jgi:uncharacterized protein
MSWNCVTLFIKGTEVYNRTIRNTVSVKEVKHMTQHPGEVALENSETGKNDDTGISEQAVIDYLHAHPEFFRTHAHVLSDMEAPDRWSEDADGIVDMQRFLLDRRSSEIDELRDCAQEVIETSRTNMSIQTRTHAAVLAALSAVDFAHLTHILADDWPFLLDIDVVVLGFEPPHRPDARFVSNELIQLAAGDADAYIGTDSDIVLIRSLTDDGSLFGAGAGLVRSAALARIRPSQNSPIGMLALGSRGAVFHPGQGTELINFLVRVVELLVHKALEPGGD